jgi:hypothetical protein
MWETCLHCKVWFFVVSARYVEAGLRRQMTAHTDQQPQHASDKYGNIDLPDFVARIDKPCAVSHSGRACRSWLALALQPCMNEMCTNAHRSTPHICEVES